MTSTVLDSQLQEALTLMTHRIESDLERQQEALVRSITYQLYIWTVDRRTTREFSSQLQKRFKDRPGIQRIRVRLLKRRRDGNIIRIAVRFL